jgi:diguanylate cyclase (GGDEF)-like protein
VRLEGDTVTLRDGDKVQVGKTIILKFVFQDHLDESFQQHMYDSSMRDGLTKAFNKRYFEDRLERELRYALRHKTPLSLLFLDVDHFKKLNDQHGHLAGDRVLQGFAAAMQASVRSEDVFARFGGEEFAVIARGTKLEDALIFAERLRRRVEELVVPVDDVRLAVTASIGVAGVPEIPCQQAVELVAAADRAVYMAKARGRNRVAACPNEPDAIRLTL